MAPTVYNPYTKENTAKAAAKKRKKLLQARTLRLMMEAQKPKKKKPAPPKDSERSKRAREAAITRESNKRKKKEKYRLEEVESPSANVVDGLRGSFQSSSLKIYAIILKYVTDAVGFDENSHKRFGSWPFITPRICPSSDPFNFYCCSIMEKSKDAGRSLSPEDFVVPPLMIWAPELQFGEKYYPNNRPMCAFHPGCSDCVINNGWSRYIRRAYDEDGVTALTGKEYLCSERQSANKHPYTFYSYDAACVSQSPSCVQGYWRQHGFRMTHRGAIRWTVVDRFRSNLAQGISANGFCDSMKERYKQHYHQQRKKWWSYCSSMLAEKGPATPQRLLFDFEDERSEVSSPSLNYLIMVVLEEIESRIDFYKHKMTMNGGLFLSGDHFLKIGKVLLIDNERGFVGLYSVMNEFGKILLFRIVTGTTLLEVEGSLRGLNRRYKLHGFAGPITFTTDRCCQERSFYEGNNNRGQCPVFHSFVMDNEKYEPASPSPLTGATDHQGNDHQQQKVVKYLTTSEDAITFGSADVANAAAGQIIEQLEMQPELGYCISIDSEWSLPYDSSGPSIVQITTLDDDFTTYIFQKDRRSGSFPQAVRTLIESREIKKVASCISADKSKLRDLGIAMSNDVSLQRMAKERGVIERANVGLVHIFEALFPGVKLEKDQRTRMSDWSAANLSEEQLKYAHLDSYAQALCFKKLMQIPYVDPTETLPPALDGLVEGQRMLLYTSNNAALVAEVSFIEVAKVVTAFGNILKKDLLSVKVQKSQVRRLGALVKSKKNQSFEKLFELNNNEDICIEWPIKNVRLAPSSSLPEFAPSLKTNDVIHTIEAEKAPEINEQEAERPDEVGEDGIDDEEEEGGEALEGALGERQEHHGKDLHVPHSTPDSHGHTKQDIEHIFIRFAKVLSKKHGCFGPFMARLSDAFFVPSQLDIDFIKECLVKAGRTTDEINELPFKYFKARVRRAVPQPNELERAFNRVIHLFANVEDAKSGKKFFGPKAWSLYKATLVHVRKGCLSDVLEIPYYVQVGEDSNGIPLFKCLRGTSALEGFHQKVRQLFRGFNISPRFVVALLYEFIHRWNHDVDVRVLGLSSEYADFYDGWEIEEEVEVAETLSNLELPPHSSVECTKDFVSTEEDFGIVGNIMNNLENESTEGISAVIADAIMTGDWDANTEGSSKHPVDEHQELTASAAWVARKYGRKRGCRNIRTKSEKDFFRKHFPKFQAKKAAHETLEADNFTSTRWSEFAIFWNQTLEDEDSNRSRSPRSDMTYKSAFQLMEYYKDYKRDGNAAATLHHISKQNNNLRRQWRGKDRETDLTFEAETTSLTVTTPTRGQKRVVLPIQNPFETNTLHTDDESNDFAVPEDNHKDDEDNKPDDSGMPSCEASPPAAAAAVTPLPNSTKDSNHRIRVPAFTGNFPLGVYALGYREQPIGPSNRPRKGRRCRRCGHSAEWGRWNDMHPAGKGKFNATKACKTPENQRVEGFPAGPNNRLRGMARPNYDEDGMYCISKK